jgi:hypothetical protein
MTGQCVRRPATALRVMLKNSGHIVSPNVFASWAKAAAGFRFNLPAAVQIDASNASNGDRLEIFLLIQRAAMLCQEKLRQPGQ